MHCIAACAPPACKGSVNASSWPLRAHMGYVLSHGCETVSGALWEVGRRRQCSSCTPSCDAVIRCGQLWPPACPALPAPPAVLYPEDRSIAAVVFPTADRLKQIQASGPPPFALQTLWLAARPQICLAPSLGRTSPSDCFQPVLRANPGTLPAGCGRVGRRALRVSKPTGGGQRARQPAAPVARIILSSPCPALCHV